MHVVSRLGWLQAAVLGANNGLLSTASLMIGVASAAASHDSIIVADLWRLGERETRAGRLLQAVEACRDALQEFTRERVPLDWAMTQNNLGLALWRLGERETGTERLLQAVEACRDALQ